VLTVRYTAHFIHCRVAFIVSLLSLSILVCATVMKLSRVILSIVWSCILPKILSDDRVDSVCATPNENETIQGKSVPDCNCKFHSVDYAVKHFISPILRNLTAK
jgi:hypothetical protein